MALEKTGIPTANHTKYANKSKRRNPKGRRLYHELAKGHEFRGVAI
jgi:hypothetical protein